MLLIDGLTIDDPTRPWVIAEASGNHGQDYAQAEALVLAAAKAGADAVKFQLFTAEDICVDVPILFGYNDAHDAWCTHLGVTRLRELFQLGGLPRAWCAPLKALAERVGLSWICTPFSVDAARFLVEEIGVPALKIASGDLTFTPLLDYATSTGLPLIVSTGGATLAECQAALEGPLVDAWADEHMVMLHCVSAYPADAAMMNLRCLQTMRTLLDVSVGLSDHTLSTNMIPALAVAMGCCVYEKHLVLDKTSQGVDASHSVDPDDFHHMVQVIRDTPPILGDGLKVPHPQEKHDRMWARRSPSDWLRPTEDARNGRWE